MEDKRKKFLGLLIGQKNADAVQDTVQEATETLDEAGIARKQEEGGAPAEAPVAAPPAPADPIEKAALAVVEALKAAGYAIEDEVTLVQIVKDALAASVAAEQEEEEVPPARPPALEEKALPADTTQRLADYILAATKDMGELAKGQMEIVTAVKAVSQVFPDALAALAERLDAMEKQLGDRPRQASEAEETTLNPEHPETKKLVKAVKKGLNGKSDKWLGIPLKD